MDIPNTVFTSAAAPTSGAGKTTGDVLHTGAFVGVVAHTKTKQRLYSGRGAWGLRASCDHNALRFNGHAGGGVVGNSKGYSFGYGERVGLLVDAKRKTVRMFRDGVRVEGALLQLGLKGLSFDSFRLAVDLAGLRGTIVTLTTPEMGSKSGILGRCSFTIDGFWSGILGMLSQSMGSASGLD